MCKAAPYPRCSSHAKQQYDKAVLTGTDQQIRNARINYLTSPEGIKSLREAGKHDVAERFATRRQKMIEKAQRMERLQKQITVALDLDNTTADFTGGFRDSLAKKYNLTPQEAMERYPKPIDYSFVKSGWFKSNEEFLSEFHDAEKRGLYLNLKIYPGARKTMRSLQEKGYTLRVVTARTQDYNADTKTALRRYRMPYRSLVHTEAKETEQAHLFVDDAPKQITTLTKHGKKVIAFKASYNAGMKGVGAVKDWSEMEKAVTRHAR